MGVGSVICQASYCDETSDMVSVDSAGAHRQNREQPMYAHPIYVMAISMVPITVRPGG